MWLSLAILSLGLGQPLVTDGSESNSPEWEAINRRMANDRVKVRYLQDEEVSLLKSLSAIDKEIEVGLKKADDLQQQLNQVAERFNELQKSRTISVIELARLHELAGKRVSAMVRLKRRSITRFLSRNQNPVVSRQMGDRFKYVLAYDRDLMVRAQIENEKIKKVEQELTKERLARFQATESLKSEIEKAQMLKEDRKALVQALRSERFATERMVDELSKAAELLQKEVGRIHGRASILKPQPGGFDAQQGQLPWPTVGRLEVPFGKRVDPSSDIILLAKGIDIRAAQNAEVRAVFPGEVVFADWFDGYGRMLILSHEGGYYTLYGHLESFAASVGAQLATQQLLGFVGDTGSIKGAYLYFEIREGREPVDPLDWLATD